MTAIPLTVTGLRARVVESERDLESLRDGWALLQSRCARTTIFSTWEWSVAAWRHLNREHRMFVVIVEHEEGLVGIAPLVIESKWPMRVVRFMGAGSLDYSVADYGDILVSEGLEQEVLDQILQVLHHHSDDWDILDLHQVPGHSPLILSAWLDDVDRRGLPFSVDRQDVAYQIDLPDTWQGYLEMLSGNARSSLGRKMRKLESEHDTRFERVYEPSRLQEALNTLFSLHTARWRSRGLPGIFDTMQMQEFHREVASRFLERGWLDLTILCSDGEAVGAIYNYEYDDTVSFYASGFQPKPEWDRYSLGTALLSCSITRAIDGRMAMFDLLRGDGEYKSRLGARPATAYRIRIASARAAHTAYTVVSKLHRGATVLTSRLRKAKGSDL
ncbi:MAG: GNAT family N-acetyltransferase [Chloroflexi bacterium]|nr:GNAT family N-acetyltransferase [Chloroflexota bacterium]